MPPIKHVFVLVLENRSFDHFFGLSGIRGIPRPNDPGFRAGATDRCAADPPHEFADVAEQCRGNFPAIGYFGFSPSQIPVLTTLAQSYLLFDNWYSAMPGPTWPNRFFLHAASSGGLTDSPTNLSVFTSTQCANHAFHFSNGTIYERLAGAGRKWRIYAGDAIPQVLAVQGMVERRYDLDLFRPIKSDGTGAGSLLEDLADPNYDVDYTFIEPAYNPQFTGFYTGSSQHPRSKVSDGEQLIRDLYSALRGSRLWESSVLLITWDEHGGFYDSRSTQGAVPPGDEPVNFGRAGIGAPEFDFSQTGLRVPALLISPYSPAGALASQCCPRGTTFDHASVVRSVRETFGLHGQLTARDAAVPSWLALLADVAREDCPTGNAIPMPNPSPGTAPVAGTPATAAPDSFLTGIALIARDLDQTLVHRTGAPLTAALPGRAMVATPQAATPPSASALASYVADVSERVRQHTGALRAAKTKGALAGTPQRTSGPPSLPREGTQP
jgi:phospholipase C